MLPLTWQVQVTRVRTTRCQTSNRLLYATCKLLALTVFVGPIPASHQKNKPVWICKYKIKGHFEPKILDFFFHFGLFIYQLGETYFDKASSSSDVVAKSFPSQQSNLQYARVMKKDKTPSSVNSCPVKITNTRSTFVTCQFGHYSSIMHDAELNFRVKTLTVQQGQWTIWYNLVYPAKYSYLLFDVAFPAFLFSVEHWISLCNVA